MERAGFTIIVLILLVGIAISLCNSPGGETVYNDDCMNEWVSPDGVHYWKYQSGYSGYMAPRYDHNGNLVID